MFGVSHFSSVSNVTKGKGRGRIDNKCDVIDRKLEKYILDLHCNDTYFWYLQSHYVRRNLSDCNKVIGCGLLKLVFFASTFLSQII